MIHSSNENEKLAALLSEANDNFDSKSKKGEQAALAKQTSTVVSNGLETTRQGRGWGGGGGGGLFWIK